MKKPAWEQIVLCLITRNMTMQKLKGVDGYCDWTTKDIVIEQNITGDLGDLERYARKVLRHEIMHAFALESGLNECSDWACNEEAIDWFARQGPKIYAVWQAAGAIDGEEVDN